MCQTVRTDDDCQLILISDSKDSGDSGDRSYSSYSGDISYSGDSDDRSYSTYSSKGVDVTT